MKNFLCCLLMAITLATSCMNEDDATPVVIYVTPNSYEATSNDKIYFDIVSNTINETITLFEIATFDKDSGLKTVYSSRPSSKQFTYRFEYTLANYPEDITIEFVFSAVDNINNRQEIRVPILVRGNATSVDELTGVAIYSPSSGKNDGFSFKHKQSVNSNTATDEELDIYVKPQADENSELLSRCWASKTGLRFCKFNNFDYASASLQSVAAVFSTSTTEPEIDNLEIGDIVFVGQEKVAIAVIRVVNIYDGNGVSDDRYEISIKIVGTPSSESTPPAEDSTEQKEETQPTE